MIETSVIDRATCHRHISEHIFKLRPEQYQDNHPIWPGAVGLEVEMLPVLLGSETGKPELVRLEGGDNALADCLRSLAAKRGWECEEDVANTGGGNLLKRVLMDCGGALTFEPGGQLEFSSIPYPCLGDAVLRLNIVQADLDDALAKEGIGLIQVGNNPFYGIDDVGLQMPKPRYQAMDRHFADIGPWGQKMMRLTCTLQVCLDFGSHEMVMAQRFLMSQLLAPFATAIFANSPFAEGQPSGHVGYRSLAWRSLDPSRTGVPKNLRTVVKNLDKASCVDVYLKMLMDSKVVFVEALEFQRPTTSVTFEEWLETPIDGHSPTYRDLETQMSLLFPEVRPRNFLELRSIDCQARAWQIVPAAFYTGLLYDDQNLVECIDLLLPHLDHLEDLLVKAADGLKNPVLAEVSAKLMERAILGFTRLPSCFLSEGSLEKISEFNQRYTAKGLTPGDELLSVYTSEYQGKELSWKVFETVESRWQDS